MPKTSIRIFIFIFALTLCVPQTALASWWNPFSWFKKHEVIIQPERPVPYEVIPEITADEATSTQATSTPPQKVDTGESEVSDESQKKIILLEKKILSLEKQIKTLEETNKSVATKYNSCQDFITSVSKAKASHNPSNNPQVEEKLEALDTKLFALTDPVENLLQSYSDWQSVPVNRWYVFPSADQINVIVRKYKELDPNVPLITMSEGEPSSFGPQLMLLLSQVRMYKQYR